MCTSLMGDTAKENFEKKIRFEKNKTLSLFFFLGTRLIFFANFAFFHQNFNFFHVLKKVDHFFFRNTFENFVISENFSDFDNRETSPY